MYLIECFAHMHTVEVSGSNGDKSDNVHSLSPLPVLGLLKAWSEYHSFVFLQCLTR